MKELEIPSAFQPWLAKVLAKTELKLSKIEALRVEASHRSFYRIHTGGDTLILMLSPPKIEDNDRFLALAHAFADSGVNVPVVHEANEQLGAFLMSDLGNVHLQETYDGPAQQDALNCAISHLAHVAKTTHPAIAGYTQDRFVTELSIFHEWFQTAYLQQPQSLDSFLGAGRPLLSAIDSQPTCCIHRDYHCRNLLFTQQTLGVVDFQDALIGPILYDIASLLRDCYHTFSEELVETNLRSFLRLEHAELLVKTQKFDEIKRLFDFTAIQRQLKAIGIFARLDLRDDKPSHLGYIQPTLQRIIKLAGKYQELQPLNLQLKNCFKQMLDSPRVPSH